MAFDAWVSPQGLQRFGSATVCPGHDRLVGPGLVRALGAVTAGPGPRVYGSSKSSSSRCDVPALPSSVMLSRIDPLCSREDAAAQPCSQHGPTRLFCFTAGVLSHNLIQVSHGGKFAEPQRFESMSIPDSGFRKPPTSGTIQWMTFNLPSLHESWRRMPA